MKVDLIRDLLDKQLVDESGMKMGRVDGLVVEWRENEPPLVDHFQIGAQVLARRLGPRWEKFAQWVRKKIHAHDNPVEVIQWPLVGEITQHHIKILVDANHTGILDAEYWLREHIVKKIPGAAKSNE